MERCLLDDLSAGTGLFISDLRTEEGLRAALDFLTATPPEGYSLAQWRECLDYLFPQEFARRPVGSYEDAAAFLVRQRQLCSAL